MRTAMDRRLPVMQIHSASKTLLYALVASLILCTSHAVLGQAVNGTLLGTVTDTTGASVPNAKVMATETSTGAVHASTTNDSGNYTFPDLPPGTYSVTVEAQGFKKATQPKIDLLSNSSTRVDMALETGSVS